jgi:hypothetical protein
VEVARLNWRWTSTYLLTPWCRILFEKLNVTQLVKKILLSLWNPNVHYHVHKSPTLDPMLSQANPVRSIDTNLPKVPLNVILSPTPRFSQWSLRFGPPHQNPLNTSPLPHACHMSSPPHPEDEPFTLLILFTYENTARWFQHIVPVTSQYCQPYFRKKKSLQWGKVAPVPEHHAMKAYWEWRYSSTHSWPQH